MRHQSLHGLRPMTDGVLCFRLHLRQSPLLPRGTKDRIIPESGAADRRASRSSNGMRRRIEFARMLLLAPDLLLLDEAHVGLDPDAWRLVEHLIASVTRRGGSALIVAHEEERIRPLVDGASTLIDGVLTGNES